MRLLNSLCDALNKLFSIFAGVSLALILAITVCNMFLRAFFTPFGATSEVVGLLSSLTIAFALGYTQANKGHINIDLITEKLPERLKRSIEFVIYLLSVLIFSLATWQVFLYAGRVSLQGALSEQLSFPYFILIYAVSFGLAVLTLSLVVDSIKSLIGAIGKWTQL